MYIKRQRRQWLQLGRAIRKGHVVAYPCEGVFGVGCDPRHIPAIRRVLALKHRPAHKGLIILAADWRAASAFLSARGRAMRVQAESHWPGPVTCLMDAGHGVNRWVRGAHRNIAIRISDFPPLQILCRAAGGAVVSTSANTAGGSPWSPWTFRRKLGHSYCILGPTGGRDRPSTIVDLARGQILR